MDTKYNGWTNYETWRVNLEICDEYLNSLAIDRQHFATVGDLADHLKDYVDEVLTNFGETTEGLALDYARSFVSGVDWYEIASHYEDELIAADEEEDDDANGGPFGFGCPANNIEGEDA